MADGDPIDWPYEEWPPWFPYLHCSKKRDNLSNTAKRLYQTAHDYYLKHGEPLPMNEVSRRTGIPLRLAQRYYQHLVGAGLMDQVKYTKGSHYLPIEAVLKRGWRRCSTEMKLAGYQLIGKKYAPD